MSTRICAESARHDDATLSGVKAPGRLDRGTNSDDLFDAWRKRPERMPGAARPGPNGMRTA